MILIVAATRERAAREARERELAEHQWAWGNPKDMAGTVGLKVSTIIWCEDWDDYLKLHESPRVAAFFRSRQQ